MVPRANVSPATKSAIKAAPAAAKSVTSATPPAQGKTRPTSALSHSGSPASSRRFVSQPPPGPSTSSSAKRSPRLNRSTSLHNLPKSRTVTTEHVPVPPIPRAAGSTISEQDYSHLPAFMRPTQASSGKVVVKPTSSTDKKNRPGS